LIINESKKNNARYKWEFLRRNQLYKEKWQALKTKMEDKYTKEFIEKRYIFFDNITKEEERFNEIWGLSGPSHYFNPELSYDDLITRNEKSAINFKLLMVDEWFFPSNIFEKPISVESDGRSEHEFSEKGIIILKVNLNYSNKKLKDLFGVVTKKQRKIFQSRFEYHCHEKFMKAGGNKDPDSDEFKKYLAEATKALGDQYSKQKVKKAHRGNFELYLKTFDLSDKDELTWGQIKNRLKLNSKETARGYYNAAKKLITEGFNPYVKKGG
jgi:hypothetical protein